MQWTWKDHTKFLTVTMTANSSVRGRTRANTTPQLKLIFVAAILGLALSVTSICGQYYLNRDSAEHAMFAEYLKDFPEYDYNGTLNRLRRTQFGHIPKDEVYLDFTGAGVYQTQQINKAMHDLKTTMKCNTHSASACSKRTEKAIEEVR